MKRHSKRLMLFGLLFVSLSLLPGFAKADPGDPGEDPDAPIDGGIGLLVAAGVGYGFKKLRDSRKKSLAEKTTDTML